jgi:hypothetical protein
LSRRSDHRDGREVEPYSILRENEDGSLEYNHQVQAQSLIIRDDEWEDRIRGAYPEDSRTQKVLKEPATNARIQVNDGVILVDGLICTTVVKGTSLHSSHDTTTREPWDTKELTEPWNGCSECTIFLT